ncbi:uncharacterized protein G2W53_018101 [Senna tora]|uniref:Uncharacterized protein n=1 Tax=Senna tora TaxID=362788 RepID=A0A834TS28_9FABA|nr:uncharacterized protein G2W53_018101 [Senna tora]
MSFIDDRIFPRSTYFDVLEVHDDIAYLVDYGQFRNGLFYWCNPAIRCCSSQSQPPILKSAKKPPDNDMDMFSSTSVCIDGYVYWISSPPQNSQGRSKYLVCLNLHTYTFSQFILPPLFQSVECSVVHHNVFLVIAIVVPIILHRLVSYEVYTNTFGLDGHYQRRHHV